MSETLKRKRDTDDDVDEKERPTKRRKVCEDVEFLKDEISKIKNTNRELATKQMKLMIDKGKLQKDMLDILSKMTEKRVKIENILKEHGELEDKIFKGVEQTKFIEFYIDRFSSFKNGDLDKLFVDQPYFNETVFPSKDFNSVPIKICFSGIINHPAPVFENNVETVYRFIPHYNDIAFIIEKEQFGIFSHAEFFKYCLCPFSMSKLFEAHFKSINNWKIVDYQGETHTLKYVSACSLNFYLVTRKTKEIVDFLKKNEKNK